MTSARWGKEVAASKQRSLSKAERKRYDRRVSREGFDDAIQPKSWIQYRYVLIVSLFILMFAGGSLYLTQYYNPEILPPTAMAGHIEESPPSHILSEPMDIRVQKHMLEHSDGDGHPGVVIDYNCEDFTCQDEPVSNLIEIVKDYPENVYLAPYRGTIVKLALTKLGKIEIPDQFNEGEIRDFIESSN